LPDALGTLIDLWPACFEARPHKRRPLKIGIDLDVLARTDAISPLMLSHTLARYTTNEGYLWGMKAGADRFDLDGNVAGQVAPDHAHGAAALLRGIIKRKQKRLEVATAKIEAAKPKRLGLAELKQAALARRDMAVAK
jgi:ProP effector